MIVGTSVVLLNEDSTKNSLTSFIKAVASLSLIGSTGSSGKLTRMNNTRLGPYVHSGLTGGKLVTAPPLAL